MSKFVRLFCFVIFPFVATAQSGFIENKGQWHKNVLFKSEIPSGAFFLEKQGFTVLLQDPEDLLAAAESVHKPGGHSEANARHSGAVSNGKIKCFAYKTKFLGSNPNAQSYAEKYEPGYNNYFIGNDPKKWAPECRIAGSIRYKNIYPGIDLRYYSDAGGNLKYDFIVGPGANPALIGIRYDGPRLSIENDELKISTTLGDVKELAPYSYQPSDKIPVPVDAKYVIKDNVVSFKIKNYDKSKELIIDPSVIFSSFTGSRSDNWGYTATPGPDGSFFAGGISFETGYPVSPGAFDVSFSGGTAEGSYIGYDISIMKFSPNGSLRVYATYLGGSGNEQPHSMIVDAAGNLIVAGRTNSLDYPVKTNLTNVSSRGRDVDIIITKFNAAGTALIGSIKYGGSGDDGVNIRAKYVGSPGAESLRRNYGDDARSEVILAGGNIVLASCTQSRDFPLQGAAGIQSSFGGGNQDGVIISASADLNSVSLSTYFGGENNDACFVLAQNPTNGKLYVGGATASTYLPGNTTGVINGTFNGGAADGFVTIINGNSVEKTTFISSSTPNSIDMLYGLKFDRLGFPYIMGTTSGNFPVNNARFSNPGSRQYIAKLRPDLSGYVYSTIFGTATSDPNISPVAFMVDRCENVYVSGWGGGPNNEQNYNNGKTTGLPEVDPLANIPRGDGNDFYFFVLQKNADQILFASHYGQFGGYGDHVDGGTSRFDDNGIIYQAICGNCSGRSPGQPRVFFPTTPGAWSVNNGSTACNEIAVKIEMNFTGVSGIPKSYIDGVNRNTGCIPLAVELRDTILKAKTYYWDFGDGSPVQKTAAPNNKVNHIYTNTGSYRVMLISEDSATCNIRDTSYTTIVAGNNKAALGFNATKLLPCENLSFRFDNTSVPSGTNFGPASFVWDFGDGSAPDTSGTESITHTYRAEGAYNVRLTLIDSRFCNYPDDSLMVLRISPSVDARFTGPLMGCVPFDAFFTNTSLGGQSFSWQLEDGTIFSTDVNATYTFNSPGTYRVRLIATDPNTCNRVDTSDYLTLRVYGIPTAAFDWAPNPPQENVPVTFTNQSIDATQYIWYFGDGDSSTMANPIHQFNKTGTYRTTLVALNQAGCFDTTSRDVSVIVLPLLDVPNAFTPGQSGPNQTIYVKGFGIQRMVWRIYNRWGQLVFESQDPSVGWNGYFKGKLQAMDVYAYTLDAELVSGEKIKRKGDITLIR